MHLKLTINSLNKYDLATRGAIISMLMVLKARDGYIRNDDVVIAKMMNIQIRTWRKMKATLIAEAIIYVDGDDIKSNMYDVNNLTNENGATKFTPNIVPIIESLPQTFEVCPKHDSPFTEVNNETNTESMRDVSKDQVDTGVAGDCHNGRMSTEVNVKDEVSELSVKERKNHYKKKEKNPPKGGFYSAHTYTREEALREPVPLHIEVKPWLEMKHCSTALMEIEVDDLKGLEDLFTAHYEAQDWRTPNGAKITDRVAKFRQWIFKAELFKKNQQLRGNQSNQKPLTNYDELILEIENGEK